MADFGIVFGATGQLYRNLARRAARNARQVMPEVSIDLYTDEPLEDAVFDRVFLVPKGPRPKMEALRRSRFERTLYLDADAVVVNDISDVFELLRQADLVGAHEQYGSAPVAMQKVRLDIPVAYRQINGGVLGIRKSAKTEAFLRQWQNDFDSLRLGRDQPLLRELLYQSDLRIVVLPSDYNQMHFPFVRVASPHMMAPRILHIPRLHDDAAFGIPPDQPFNPAEFMPEGARDRFNELLKTDRTLGASASLRTMAGEMLREVPFLRRLEAKVRRLLP